MTTQDTNNQGQVAVAEQNTGGTFTAEVLGVFGSETTAATPAGAIAAAQVLAQTPTPPPGKASPVADLTNLVLVRFHYSWNAFNGGETASLDPVTAKSLLDSGIADLV